MGFTGLAFDVVCIPYAYAVYEESGPVDVSVRVCRWHMILCS